MLDPAVNHEFERILKALEDKTAEAKRLNDELNGTTFTYESKQGRMLMAKCRTLAVSLYLYVVSHGLVTSHTTCDRGTIRLTEASNQVCSCHCIHMQNPVPF